MFCISYHFVPYNYFCKLVVVVNVVELVMVVGLVHPPSTRPGRPSESSMSRQPSILWQPGPSLPLHEEIQGRNSCFCISYNFVPYNYFCKLVVVVNVVESVMVVV